MARKKVREYSAKQIFKSNVKRLVGMELPILVAQVTAETSESELLNEHPWLASNKLVVKPDMLFGQRGKHDLVGLNLDFPAAMEFVRQRLGRAVTVKGCTGAITTFLLEPFIPHDAEYYLSLMSTRLGTQIHFSPAGGMDVEEHWDQVRSVHVDSGSAATPEALAPLIADLPLEQRPALEAFLAAAFQVYEDLDASMLEMNPFTFDPRTSQPFPLDMRLELDDTAKYRSGSKWGDVEFPMPFGRELSGSEEYVHSLDEATGASLKFTVLNPQGRVWLMVAGGGASVIYADTVADLGFSAELGNYGEYSGAPNTKETYLYARAVLECVTTHTDGRGRALLIGGGIANFTDVAATFTGIISALREKAAALAAAKVRIFVRRGGPNYVKGLDLMRALGKELGVPIQVYGPEASMTGICQEAIDYVKSFDQ